MGILPECMQQQKEWTDNTPKTLDRIQLQNTFKIGRCIACKFFICRLSLNDAYLFVSSSVYVIYSDVWYLFMDSSPHSHPSSILYKRRWRMEDDFPAKSRFRFAFLNLLSGGRQWNVLTTAQKVAVEPR